MGAIVVRSALALRLFGGRISVARELCSHPDSYVNRLAPAADLDLRHHRGDVGPRRLARIEALARRARSHRVAWPAHAPAASPHPGASGPLPASRPFPARDRLASFRSPAPTTKFSR